MLLIFKTHVASALQHYGSFLQCRMICMFFNGKMNVKHLIEGLCSSDINVVPE